MNRHSERGNALWFILLAIVLLGALTMLLSRSGSSVDQNADVEQMRIKASQVMRYAKSIQSAVEQMKLNGVSENGISFQNSTTTTNYTNTSCDDDTDQNYPDCRVFDVGGAGLVYMPPPPGTNGGAEWIFTGENNVGTTAKPIGTTAAGSGNDLIMLLPGANNALCLQINRDLDVDSSGTIPGDASGAAVTPFTGSYPAALNILDGDPTAFELDGHEAGCFIDTAPNPDVTYFYFVLLAR
jgi:type II secretory pathway pseudopilin PulG